MKQNQILMKKAFHLVLSILELSKIVMYEFQYDYVKQKYGEKAKMCYLDTDSLIKADDIQKDIANEVETRFETSNYALEKPLPKGKNKNVIDYWLQGAQLSGQQLVLGNQRFPVRVRLPTMCRGELSAIIAWLMSKCL